MTATPDIEAIRARLAAIEGEWWSPPAPDGTTFFTSSVWQANDLIAHAPADLRALCDEVARLRSGVDRLISYLGDVKASLSFSHDIDGAEYAASDAEAFAVTLLAAQPAAGTEGGG